MVIKVTSSFFVCSSLKLWVKVAKQYVDSTKPNPCKLHILFNEPLALIPIIGLKQAKYTFNMV